MKPEAVPATQCGQGRLLCFIVKQFLTNIGKKLFFQSEVVLILQRVQEQMLYL